MLNRSKGQSGSSRRARHPGWHHSRHGPESQSTASRKQRIAYENDMSRWRHLAENHFPEIGGFRSIAIRHDKTDTSHGQEPRPRTTAQTRTAPRPSLHRANRQQALAESQRNEGETAIQRAAEYDQNDPRDKRENLQQPRIRGRLVGIEAACSPPSSHESILAFCPFAPRGENHTRASACHLRPASGAPIGRPRQRGHPRQRRWRRASTRRGMSEPAACQVS